LDEPSGRTHRPASSAAAADRCSASRNACPALRILPPLQADFKTWLPLWDGYNAFYGRIGPTALPLKVTRKAWSRFFDKEIPVFALLAERDDAVVGLVHYLYHRSTTRPEGTCYLQDLFTAEDQRGQGVGRALIEGVYSAASRARIQRVYWHTHESNAAGRRLYDQVATNAGFIVYAIDLDAAP